MKQYIIIKKPITVPKGKYCWEINGTICEHFDNEGGHNTCNQGFDIDRKCDVDDGVLKPIGCLCLDE